MTKHIYYKEIEPAANLKQHIFCYWYFEYKNSGNGIYEHIILPDGCPSLIFINIANGSFKTINLFGPRLTYYKTEIPPGSKFLGIRFMPGTIKSLLGISGNDIRDKSSEAEEFFKNEKLFEYINKTEDDERTYNGLNEIFSKTINEGTKKPDEFVQKAVKKIIETKGQLKISEIVNKINISERQLLRKFKEEVGMTLKELSRIRRNRAALFDLIIENKEKIETVLNSGFFDQPHFNKDFAAISGINPTEFLKLYSQIEHGQLVK